MHRHLVQSLAHCSGRVYSDTSGELKAEALGQTDRDKMTDGGAEDSITEMDSALADLGFSDADLVGLELQPGSQPSPSPEPTVRSPGQLQSRAVAEWLGRRLCRRKTGWGLSRTPSPS